jgi:CubicO group peptidase (beta-lactamase class C family)
VDVTKPGPWDPTTEVAAVVHRGRVVDRRGDTGGVRRVASITKLATSWAVLVAIEEGSVALDDPVGPPGATVAHLLAHASGLDFDTDRVLAAPGVRRIYSNTGYELLGSHVEARTGLSFDTYLTEGVLAPLGMVRSELRGSPAADLHSCVDDLVTLLGELRSPRLVDPSTAKRARTCAFPGLAGVLPGWGRQEPCDWGLGPELRGDKQPHWMGRRCSPATFGHFGGSGTLLWFDPTVDLGCVVFADRAFDEWAVDVWPGQSDAVWSGWAGRPSASSASSASSG